MQLNRIWLSLGISVIYGCALGSVTAQEPTDGHSRGIKVVNRAPDEPVTVTLQVQISSDGRSRMVARGDVVHSGEQLELFIGVDRPAYVYVAQVSSDGSAVVLYPEAGDLLLSATTRTRLPTEPKSIFQLDRVVGMEHLVVVASARPLVEADRAAAEAFDLVVEPGAADKVDFHDSGALASTLQAAETVATPASAADKPSTNANQKTGQAGPDKSSPTAIQKAGAPGKTSSSGTVGSARVSSTSRPRADRLLTMQSRGIELKTPGDATSTESPGTATQVQTDEDGVAVCHFWLKHER